MPGTHLHRILPAGYRCMAPPPVGMVERHQLEALVELLCEVATRTDSGTSMGLTMVLHGSGGCGKTMLAQALCCHRRVQQAYPDGVLWATMGEHANEARRVVVLLDLIEWWSGEGRPRFTEVSTAGAELRQRLVGRRVLVVVDDVRHEADLEPFQELGACATLLVTTRDHRILPDGCARREIDVMTAGESLALLGAGLTAAPQQLTALVARLGRWPLLLDLVNRRLRERVGRRELDVSDAIAEVERLLDEQGLTRFDAADDDARRIAALRALIVSLQRLGEDDRQRYERLAVFPGGTEIPLSVLERYWSLNAAETRRLCARLHALSLVRHIDVATQTIGLHDVFRQCLVDRAGEALDVLHARWLDTVRPRSGRWSDLPVDEPHAWRFLAWHLRQAGRVDELAGLLFDFDWLDAKLGTSGVGELLADFELVPTAHEAGREVQLVRDVLCLASPVLAGDPSQLPGQLLGRLGDRPGVAEPTVDSSARRRVANLLSQAYGARRYSWLRPRSASLLPPGGPPLLRTVTGQDGRIRAIAIVADGTRAVSAAADGTLKLWDLEQGIELRTLAGRDTTVRAVAIAADGTRAISASADGTLKLWDLEQGAELLTFTGHDAAVNAVVISADGKRAVSASDDHTLKIWSLEQGIEMGTLAGHLAAVTAVAISRAGTRAVSGSSDRSVKSWDLEQRAAEGTLTGHGAAVGAVAVTPDGTHAVSVADDWTINLWDLTRGVALRTIAGHEHWGTAVALTPDGERVLSASRDHALELRDLATGSLLATFSADAAIHTCAVSPTGRVFVAGDANGQLHFLELVEPKDGITTIEAFAATIEEPPRNGETTTRKRRVEEIFDAALDVAPEERTAFLMRACAGNDELRWEVEELLEVERAQTFGPLPSGELRMVSVLANLHPSLKGLSLAPGMQLGRYELLRSLGQGGMGTVFLAHDKRLHRRVAIKFLHAATPDMTERFLAEARNTARCKHDNIVVIHDVDEIDGRPYMVLEFLEGEPLRQRLAGLADRDATTTRGGQYRDVAASAASLTVAEVLDLVIPVVRALVCAHAQGIVHRDLKPENVFLCSSGTVKVLDFGIAKAVIDVHSTLSLAASTLTLATQEHVVTEQGALLGTVPYMSPEQWGTDEIDERTDLWAVGIMLYEMLAGQHPLAPLSYGKMQLQVPELDLPMPSIRAVVPGPGALADIVDSCLRKHKDERMRSAEALLQALEAVRVELTLEAVRIELSPATSEAVQAGTPTTPQASVEAPGSPLRESRELEAPAGAASPPRPQEHTPSASWLAATASWLATLALLAFWPRFAISSFPDRVDGVVLAVSARADDALRATYNALCASMRAVDAEATRCIELPRIGVGGRELREAAATAGASLIVWLDEEHGVRLLPASTSAGLLSDLPTLHDGLAQSQQHLAGILHPLARALAGDMRVDALRVPPVGSDAGGWRLAALAWYLNVLTHDQHAIPVEDVRRTMAHCRDEGSLADPSCALVHYVHAHLEPTPRDARYWLEMLRAYGPPSFADPITVELASDGCMHAPERLEAALLRLAERWAQEPCRLLTLTGPARCLLARYPQASAALQPVAHPVAHLEARCEANLPTGGSSSDGAFDHR